MAKTIETVTIQQATVEIEGIRPLLMHNPRGLNHHDPLTQAQTELTGKRKKTLQDHEQIARNEWELGLYLDEQLGPYVPGPLLWRTIVAGARLTKSGKDVERGVLDLTSQDLPLLYKGPRDMKGLWANPEYRDTRPAKVAGRGITRTRPRFPQWKLKAVFMFDPSMVNPHELHAFIEAAGRFEGLGDGRRIGFGRFIVESFKSEEMEVG